MDSNLSFDTHITEKCKKAMYTLHRIRSFRSHLSKKCLLQIVQSLVISQLDYCSSLLYGLPTLSLAKLQRVQNFAAKLILNKSTFDSSTECLKQLHWLPVKYRILFRLLCSFKCVNGQAPVELIGFLDLGIRMGTVSDLPLILLPFSFRKCSALCSGIGLFPLPGHGNGTAYLFMSKT